MPLCKSRNFFYVRLFYSLKNQLHELSHSSADFSLPIVVDLNSDPVFFRPRCYCHPTRTPRTLFHDLRPLCQPDLIRAPVHTCLQTLISPTSFLSLLKSDISALIFEGAWFDAYYQRILLSRTGVSVNHSQQKGSVRLRRHFPFSVYYF